MRSRRLHVFSTVVATLDYCVRKAGLLFLLAWFPCALESVCRIGLEWLTDGSPPFMPQWLLFVQFFPPTWLSPLVNAPAVAMVWAFVLSIVCDQNPDRGIVTVPGIRLGWIRFELSPAVLLGAAVFVATNFLDGMFRLAQFQLLVAVYPLFEGREGAFDAWARWSDALPILAVSAVAAWTYPIAAQVLRTGAFDRTRALDLMRGNRLRLTAIFFLLNLASYLFYALIRPATNWIVQSLVDPPPWTLREAIIRHVIQFPFETVWVVAWAVTLGMVMKALALPVRRTSPTVAA
ncbi:MAG: hypothetical protein QOI46_6343 [Alphaproteobacteria bacterium]|nr:hypothetical protein [Alphaproteobacteria bacterium]